jgi:hypothetical protein
MRCWHCGKAFRATAGSSEEVLCPGCGAKLGRVATPAVLAPAPGPLNGPDAQPWRPSADPGSAVRNPTLGAGGGGNPAALLVAVVLFIAAGYWFWDSYQKLNNWAKTTGEVVSLRDGRRFSRYATVVFTAANGRRYRFEDSSHDTRVGQSVKVLYPPTDPNEAKLDSDANLFLGPILLTTIACACVGLWRMPLFHTTPWQPPE